MNINELNKDNKYFSVKVNFMDIDKKRDGYSLILLDRSLGKPDIIISALVDLNEYDKYKNENPESCPDLPNNLQLWKDYFNSILQTNDIFSRNDIVNNIDYDLSNFFNNGSNFNHFAAVLENSIEEAKEILFGIYNANINSKMELYIEIEEIDAQSEVDSTIEEKYQQQEKIQAYSEIYENKTILSSTIQIDPQYGVPVYELKEGDDIACIISSSSENVSVLKNSSNFDIVLDVPITLKLYKMLDLGNNYYKVFLYIDDSLLAQDILEQKSRVKTEKNSLLSAAKDLIPNIENERLKIKKHYSHLFDYIKIITLVLGMLIFIYFIINYGLIE